MRGTCSEDIVVLLISPLPPPAGGIGLWTGQVVRKGLPEPYRIELVDTSLRGDRLVFASRISLRSESQRTLRILRMLLWRIVTKRPAIAHLNCALSHRGVFRDALCVLLCRLFRVSVVTNYRGDVADMETRLGRWSLAALRCVARRSARNVVLTERSREALLKVAGVNCQVDKLPNFVDDSIFEMTQPPRRSSSTKVIYVGGITRGKGCDLILDVARQEPQIDFELVGHAYPEAKEWLTSLPSNVRIHPEMTHEEALRAISAADILLFPSNTEGFPNVVAEAMALGVPVVATAVGAIPEMIENGRGGITISVGNRDQALAAIRSLERNPATRLAMASFNRAKARRDYSYSVVIRGWTQLYDRVLRSNGKGGTADRDISGARQE